MKQPGSRSELRRRLSDGYLPDGLVPGQRRPAHRPASPGSRRPPGSRRARPSTTGQVQCQLERVGDVADPRGRSLRRLLRQTRPAPTTRRATSSSSSATTARTRTSTTRRPTRLGRRTTSYGGKSLYTGVPGARSRARLQGQLQPALHHARCQRGQDFIFNAEYPMVRWLERNGYDVSYETGVDTDRYGSLIKNHRIFMSTGHDEYWSGQQRANVEAARDAGVNLAFFSGNEVFWKTRWENDHRTLSVTRRRTTRGRAPRRSTRRRVDGVLARPGRGRRADGVRPENAAHRPVFTVNTAPRHPGPGQYHNLPFWRHTVVASLRPADGDAAARHAGLRVGLRHGERLPAAARAPSLRQPTVTELSSTTSGAPELHPGLRSHVRRRHRDPQHDALPRAQRRARLRRRHGAVVVGPRPRPRPRPVPRRSATCSRRRSTSSPTCTQPPQRCSRPSSPG